MTPRRRVDPIDRSVSPSTEIKEGSGDEDRSLHEASS